MNEFEAWSSKRPGSVLGTGNYTLGFSGGRMKVLPRILFFGRDSTDLLGRANIGVDYLF